MLTKEQVLSAIKNGRGSDCIDGRDYSRLAAFLDSEHFSFLGLELKEGGTHAPINWTEENILEQLKGDLDFAFEKALDKRGLSAGLMHSVVKMWLWILEDDLQYHSKYAHYGLPLFKAVAEKYGFQNRIGSAVGDEYKFSSECD